MNIVGIIPARMGSSRFPGKPMAEILGMPMIGHVYCRSVMSDLLDDTYVATCDEVIFEYIRSIGGKAVMTSDEHTRCSDRCAEAMLKIEVETGKKIDIMVMIQGDEPVIFPKMIDLAVNPIMEDPNINITNLMADIETVDNFEDPNEVKVVVDKDDFALYFSREPIPSRKKGVLEVPMKKQVCIIPFRRDFLLKYNSMEQTPLEIIESIDMLRLLENGIGVKMVESKFITISVDTPADLEKASELLEKDLLVKEYKN